MSVPAERLDISGPIGELCELLGFEKETVCRIVFEPTQVTVETFALDDVGRIRTIDDRVLVDEHTLSVMT